VLRDKKVVGVFIGFFGEFHHVLKARQRAGLQDQLSLDRLRIHRCTVPL
jgi:hypothetical protein